VVQNFSKVLKIGFVSFDLGSLKKSCWKIRTFSSSTFRELSLE